MDTTNSAFLNNAAHGYVFIPLIITLRNAGVFEYLKHHPDTAIKTVADDLKLNQGPLHIILNSLQGLKILNIKNNHLSYVCHAELEDEIDKLPSSLINLYDIDPLSYLQNATNALFSSLPNTNEFPILGNFLEGCKIIPLLVSLFQHNQGQLLDEKKLVLDNLSLVAQLEITSLFAEYSWGKPENGSFILSEFGKWAYQHSLSYALGLSYRPLLTRLKECIMGDFSSLFKTQNNNEGHVDRALNVLSSGAMHKTYFKSISNRLSEIFNDQAIDKQPAYVIDTGCGDGTFLGEIYDHITHHTHRGKFLEEFPLVMIGVDFNQAALEETSKKLTYLGIPFLTIHGDIGNPSKIINDLKSHQINTSKRILHIRSFLDHDRPYIAPVSTDVESDMTTVFLKQTGDMISSGQMALSLQEHLKRWSDILKPIDDLMIFEVHAVDSRIAYEEKDHSISLHFDLLQALSCQFLVSADEFASAAKKGLLDSKKTLRFPEDDSFTRITFNHFKKTEEEKNAHFYQPEKIKLDQEKNSFNLNEKNLLSFIQTELNSLSQSPISLDSSILNLGLDSLELGKLTRKLNTILPFKINLPFLFKHSKLSDLIQALLKKTDGAVTNSYNTDQTAENTKNYPLALSQEPMWIWYELIGDTSSYNVPRIEHFKGAFCLETFKQALLHVISRHQILRTTYNVQEGIPYQRVVPLTQFSLPLQLIDLSAKKDKTKAAYQLMQVEVNKPFELVNGEVLRALVIKLDHDEHILILTMHHMVTDGSSIPIFWHELVSSYDAFRKKQEPSLTHLNCQYFDWALKQRAIYEKGFLKDSVNFWKEKLQGQLLPIDLPADFNYPKQQTFNGNRLRFNIDVENTSALRTLCAHENATLFMGIMSAWGTFLCKHAQQEEIFIGTPWANRDAENIQQLIGCFVNTVPIKVTVSEKLCFADIVKQTTQFALEAFEHASLPFHKMVETADIHAPLGRLPIYQTMIALEEENGWFKEHIFSGTSRVEGESALKAIRDTSKFEISLSVREKNSQEGKFLEGEFVYNTDLFAEDTAVKMKDRFVQFLRKLVQSPQLEIQKIPIVSKSEETYITETLNHTDSPLPDVETVFDLFKAQAIKTPSKTALKWETGSNTYQELETKVQKFAIYLKEKGVTKGAHIGLMMERTPDLLIALLAVMQLGAVYVPIDVEYPLERKKFLIQDAQLSFLIKQACLPSVHLSIIEIDFTEPVDLSSTAIELPSGHDVAYLLYTSGTTGIPKGVKITHRNLLNDIWHITNKQIAPEELKLTLFSTNICFDQSVEEIFPSLCTGGTVLLVETILDLWWRKEDVTLIVTTPSQFSYAMNDHLPPTIRSIILGGEALSQSMVDQIFSNTSAQKIFNSYGPTECTDQATVCMLTPQNKEVSLGKPISNVKIYILDKHLNLLPQSTFGELCIGGEAVGAGYHQREELTSEKFILNPFGIGKLYRTGDVARWNKDGLLECRGRNDSQIKIHGVRIEKGEIESVIKNFKNVSSAHVVCHKDETGNPYLVAFITPDTISVDALLNHCKTFLINHMIPQRIIPLPTFPLTVNGKLDEKKLIAGLTKESLIKKESSKSHLSTIEKQILQLFKNILKREDISAETSFLAAGGHSLLVVQLLARLKEQFGYRLKMREFIECCTPIALSQKIQGNHPSTVDLAQKCTLKGYENVSLGGNSILIIGAGIAGIMAAIECKKRKIPFKLIEKSHEFGGIWLNGCNHASRLQTTSHVYVVDKEVKQKDVYPNRASMLNHLTEIVELHDLRKQTLLNTTVEEVTKTENGFAVEVVDSSHRRSILKCDGILVCTGKHHVPFIPSFECSNGAPPIVHASSLDGTDLKDKEVVILGAGSFAVEALRIAAESGAKKITLLARKSYWILPTFADTIIHSGINSDLKPSSNYDHLVKQLHQWLCEYYTQFGLTHFIPEHCSFDAHISTSDEFFKIVQQPHVTLKIDEISHVSKNGVFLKKAKTSISADLIIAATGYKDPQFSFLESSFGNNPTVYKGFMLANDPRIGFVGFLDMVTSAPAVIPLNLELCFEAMSNLKGRPSISRVQQWIDQTPDDLLFNVKSHIAWLIEEKEHLQSDLRSSFFSNITEKGNLQHPNQVAVIEGNRVISYAELDLKILNIISFLSNRKSETIVAILPDTANALILLLAILKHGCKVFLFQENHDFTKTKINEKIDLIFTTKNAHRKNQTIFQNTPPVYFIDDLDTIKTECDPCFLPSLTLQECVFWTSGSTGNPKGVIHTHDSLEQAVIHFGLTAWEFFEEPPRLLFYNHIAHLGGFMAALMTLNKGGTLILSTYQPHTVAKEIEQFSPNLLVMMSSWFLDLAHSMPIGNPIWKTIKQIVLGGEPISVYAENQIKDFPIVFTFGISECGPLFKRTIGDSVPNELKTPLPQVQYSVNKENEADCVGELRIKSLSLFKGYYGSPRHEGWFNTQDFVETSDRLIYRGRKKEQIEQNLFVQDIENEIIRFFPIHKAIAAIENGIIYVIAIPLLEQTLTAASIEHWLSHQYPTHSFHVCFQKHSVTGMTGKMDRTKMVQGLNSRPKALLFPGQGIQSIDMFNHVSNHPLFKQAHEILNYDLVELCTKNPQDLNRTDICQLAIYTISIIELELILEKDPLYLNQCQFAVGLSLGEYSALTASGALSFTDGLKLLSLRGQAMQKASMASSQAMLSLSNLAKDEIIERLSDYKNLFLANDLGPDHVVIAGEFTECENLKSWAESKQSHAVILNVAGAFHTPFMTPAVQELSEAIEKTEFRYPQFPVLSNFDGEPTSNPNDIKRKLIKQLDHPVLFANSLAYLARHGISSENVMEFGRKKTVTNIFKRFLKQSCILI